MPSFPSSLCKPCICAVQQCGRLANDCMSSRGCTLTLEVFISKGDWRLKTSALWLIGGTVLRPSAVQVSSPSWQHDIVPTSLPMSSLPQTQTPAALAISSLDTSRVASLSPSAGVSRVASISPSTGVLRVASITPSAGVSRAASISPSPAAIRPMSAHATARTCPPLFRPIDKVKLHIPNSEKACIEILKCHCAEFLASESLSSRYACWILPAFGKLQNGPFSASVPAVRASGLKTILPGLVMDAAQCSHDYQLPAKGVSWITQEFVLLCRLQQYPLPARRSRM